MSSSSLTAAVRPAAVNVDVEITPQPGPVPTATSTPVPTPSVPPEGATPLPATPGPVADLAWLPGTGAEPAWLLLGTAVVLVAVGVTVVVAHRRAVARRRGGD